MLQHLDTAIGFSVVMLLLSLLLTTLVQIVITFSGLRGSNLYWGIHKLLRQVDSNLGGHAKEIADVVLKHPAVTHLGRLRGIAIRREELLRILTEMGDRQSAAAQGLKPEAQTALSALVQKVVPGATEQEIARVQSVASALGNLMPAQTRAVRETVDRMLRETNKLSAEVNAWFDTFMDRTSERFKYYTRWITAILGFALALSFQIDSLDILRQFQRNPQLRAAFVDLAGATLNRSEEVTKITQERGNLATSALEALQSDERFKTVLAGKTIDTGMDDQSDGERWLATNIPGNNEILKAYRETYEQKNQALRQQLTKTAREIQDVLEESGLQIAHTGWDWRRFPGILATGLLLSLGAPFWYNALRKLSDLRPIVTRRVEGEAPKAVR